MGVGEVTKGLVDVKVAAVGVGLDRGASESDSGSMVLESDLYASDEAGLVLDFHGRRVIEWGLGYGVGHLVDLEVCESASVRDLVCSCWVWRESLKSFSSDAKHKESVSFSRRRLVSKSS